LTKILELLDILYYLHLLEFEIFEEVEVLKRFEDLLLMEH